ncbi:MAG: sugar ABC transporter substrate-binding protein, partial [Acidimicrobiales bacterium]
VAGLALVVVSTAVPASAARSSEHKVPAVLGATGIKPYGGYGNRFPTTFPIPKVEHDKHYTIGCENPVNTGNQTTTSFCLGVSAEARALGMKYIGVVTDVTVTKQVSNFNQLVAEGANAIVLYPLAPNALSTSLANAKKHGVAVIGENVTVTPAAATPPGYEAQVWEGRDEEAYLSVAEMAKLAPHGKIAVIGIAAPVPAIKFLVTRYRYWARKFGLTIVGEQDVTVTNVSGGETAMTGLLGKYSDIQGVLAFNDTTAVGAYTAVRDEGKTGIEIVGINGSSTGIDAVKAGHVAAIIQVDAVGQGLEAALGAYDVLTKQHLPLPKVVVRPPRAIITKSDAGKVPSWQKELSEIGPKHLIY